jgi:hypothetical protein
MLGSSLVKRFPAFLPEVSRHAKQRFQAISLDSDNSPPFAMVKPGRPIGWAAERMAAKPEKFPTPLSNASIR